jgi:PepSY-associated TM region
MLKRFVILVHRWLGVALCLIFMLWFPSGIGMMYWDYPSVSPSDRLERSAALDPSRIVLSPDEAAAKLDESQPRGQVRLNTFDGRPVYRFRSGGGESIIYADTGEEQIEVPKAMMERIVSSWTGQPVNAARVEPIEEVDQWTLQSGLRDLSPVWKYSWPSGEQVYISETTGEVVQYTTTASRLGAYVGAIPHWLYFTPLRKHGPEWSRLVIWSSGIGTLAALLGIVIGIWMYSPSQRYRRAGVPTSVPYRGQKRWHMVFGLIFGLGAATWAFSGMLSMDPFPMRRTGGPAGGRRGGGGPGIPQALRGRGGQLTAFAPKHPRAALAQLPNLAVKELELTSFEGEPVYLATVAGGDTRIIPVRGEPRAEFDRQRIIDIVTKAAQSNGGAEITVLEQYDRYYLDRRRERPLPVILARLNDAERTRYYIDPKTARVVGNYSASNWMSRWLYHGLHSLDFPWLYNYRPLWDVVVIAFMVGGTALCVTSLILAWRVLGRKLGRAFARTRSDSMQSEDLTSTLT